MRALHVQRSRKGSHGMVLLEAIIAMTVFAMVVVGLVLTLDAALNAAKERNEIDMANRGLQNQMALVHAGRLNPMDKDLPDDGSGYTYHLQIEPEQMQDQKHQPVAGMYRTTITVKWKSGKEEEDRSLSELMYQP